MKYDEEEILRRDQEYIQICRESNSAAEAMKKLGLKDTRNFRRRRQRLEHKYGIELPRWTGNEGRPGYEPAEKPEQSAEVEKESLSLTTTLKQRINQQSAEIQLLREQAANTAELKKLIHGCLERDKDIPDWVYTKPKSRAMSHGVPTLFLSDLHWDEIVTPSQINFVNEFNRDIAIQRLKRTVDTTVFLSKEVLSQSPYEGIVLALGGDMFSGYIHDELRENKSGPIYEGLINQLDNLTAAINVLADEFGQVFVPCVTGNHGRIDRKPRAKYAVQDNIDWLLYQLLKREFSDRKEVQFLIPDASDAYYRIFHVRYMLTHGNQFRGGTGIAGPATPWALGDHKKRKRQDAINQPYDTLIFGHWHTLAWGINNAYVCNGSLKGYDEYAYINNYPYEPPKQALWFTHPEYGITHQMAVYTDKPKEFSATSWVSVMENPA